MGPVLENLMKSLFGSKHDREVKRAQPIVDEINQLGESFAALSDDELRGKTAEFKGRLASALEGVTEPEERKRIERETLDGAAAGGVRGGPGDLPAHVRQDAGWWPASRRPGRWCPTTCS